jgi:hypothetical protein
LYTFSSARANAAGGLLADPSGLLRIYGTGLESGSRDFFLKQKRIPARALMRDRSKSLDDELPPS